MKSARDVIKSLQVDAYSAAFARLYPKGQEQAQKRRYIEAIEEFEKLYGENREIILISAPGRTEVGGNHTDHQRGRVLAAPVNLDIICVAAKNCENVIRVKSKGYNQDTVELSDLSARESEENKAISLIRGIAARISKLGYEIGGFDAYTTSDVLKGSGLSSSAAFEVAIGNILNHVYNGGKLSAVEIAQIGQYAENVYFGKPSGLLDQAASSVGGFVTMDFKDPEHPVVEPVEFDFEGSGHTLCVVDTKGNHADLTGEYAAIPPEMKSVARILGGEYLREVDENEFYLRLPEIREKLGDRPALRAMHFFGDNERVLKQVEALRGGDFSRFKELVTESGRSSYDLLQNVFTSSAPNEQGLSVALALSESMLSGRGAWRVHGGGFAGTIQAFVPNDILGKYRKLMERVFGEGACYELMIRPVGGIEVKEEI